MRIRTVLAVPVGAAAIVLALASVAMACTVIPLSSAAIIDSVLDTKATALAQVATPGAMVYRCAAAAACDGVAVTASPGDLITVSGTGPPGCKASDLPGSPPCATGRVWNLHFLNQHTWDDSMGTCMGAAGGTDTGSPDGWYPAGLGPGLAGPVPDVVIAATTSDSTTGAIAPATGVIPGPLATNTSGTFARVCFLEGYLDTVPTTSSPVIAYGTYSDTIEIALL